MDIVFATNKKGYSVNAEKSQKFHFSSSFSQKGVISMIYWMQMVYIFCSPARYKQN